MIDFKKRASEVIRTHSYDDALPLLVDRIEAFGRECYAAGMMRAACIAETRFTLPAWNPDKRNSGLEIAEAIRSEAKGDL